MKENKINKLKSIMESNLDHSNEDWLEPSEKVWINVKENLPKKRRRRNVLPFFFLFFGLSVAAIMYGLMGSNDQSTVILHGKDSLPAEKHSAKDATIAEKIELTETIPNIQAKQNSVGETNQKADLNRNPSNSKTPNIKYSKNSNNENLFQDSKNIEVKENIVLSNKKVTADNASSPSTALTIERNVKIEEAFVPSSEKRVMVENLTPINGNMKALKQTKKETPTFNINSIEENVVEEKATDYPVFFGFGFTAGMTSNKKNAKTDNMPLSELIKSSVYKNNYSFHFEYSKVINDKLSYSVLPSVSFDQLYTTYVLNIPYDYNTEVSGIDEKENTFSHSLPTDLGNIKTKLVVARASNSPVVHNEIINFDFTSKHRIINLAIPLRLNYHFTSFEKGFYIFPYISPEYEISKKLSAQYLKSNHTFVHTKSAEINQDFGVSKFHLGLGAGLGYRLKLMDKFVLNINTSYTQYLNTHGRSNLLNAGTNLLYTF